VLLVEALHHAGFIGFLHGDNQLVEFVIPGQFRTLVFRQFLALASSTQPFNLHDIVRCRIQRQNKLIQRLGRGSVGRSVL